MPTVLTYLLLPDSTPGSILLAGNELAVIPVEVGVDETLIVALHRSLARAWGLDAVVLETHLPPAPGGDSADHVALAVLEPPPSSWSAAAGTRWGTPPTSLPERIGARAAEWLAEIGGHAPIPPRRPTWSRRGWRRRAASWIGEQLASSGRRATGPMEMRRLWSISALARVPTDAGEIWFKAVGPHFHHEPAVSTLLAQSVEGLVPAVIAADLDAGWLLLEGAGRPLRDAAGADDAILGSIGQLTAAQRLLANRHDAFVALGCPRRPLSGLADALAEAMTDAPALGGPLASSARIRRVVEWVRGRTEWLDGLDMEPALVHGDFHPGNVVTSSAGTRIIDWSDAAITHPVMEIAPWFGEVRRELRPAGWQTWLAALSRFGATESLRDHEQDAYAVSCAYQVVSYAGILRGIEPANQYQLSDGFGGHWQDLDARVPR